MFVENVASVCCCALTSISVALVAPSSECWADALCQQARLDPPQFQVFLDFGFATDIQGDRAVVGARWDAEQGTNAGAVYEYQRVDGARAFSGKILPAVGQQGAQFGTSLALRNQTLVVSAPGHNDPKAPGSGAVYVFEHDGEKWVEVQKIMASDGTFQHIFGWIVRITDDVIAISAPNDQSQGAWTGAVYVFRHNGTEWYEDQKLIASDASSGWFFGDTNGLDLDGDIMVVGAHGHPGLPQGEGGAATHGGGAAYIFHHNGSGWRRKSSFQTLRADTGSAEVSRLLVSGLPPGIR